VPADALPLRRLGRDGPELSRCGLGTWALGGVYEFGWGPQDDRESIAAIRHAVERGVNWVDTAPVYGFGRSEQVIGTALRGLRVGEEVHVFTKCGRVADGRGGMTVDLRSRSIRRECEESLRRLGVDRIDLLQFHWPDTVTGTPIEESWATMAELAEEGKVRWLGVCNFSAELLERIEPVRHVDSAQPLLNLVEDGARRDVLPWCLEHGTGVIAYSPMASGLLSGSFHERAASLSADDWRRRASSPAAWKFKEPQLTRTLALVEALRPMASGLGVSVGALAIAWVLAQRGVTGAIVGARRPAQVDGWLPAARLDLGADVLAEMERAVQASGLDAPSAPVAPPPPAPVPDGS
jgi:aryl-alcohol dehydrogenase-like predicted oxidoreductase